jgi:hypothetical protein
VTDTTEIDFDPPLPGDGPDVDDWDFEWSEEHLSGGRITTYHVEHAPPQARRYRATARFMADKPYICAVCGHAIVDRVPPDAEVPTRGRHRFDQVEAAEGDADAEAIVALIGEQIPRLLRCFRAMTETDLPDGWTAEYHDAPLSVVLRRPEDGYFAMLMPSTDGTPRWYLDAREGAPAGMADGFQAAVDHTVANAPVRIEHTAGRKRK